MTGANEMTLNEATMVEIVQYWFDNKFLNKDEPRPKVTSFKQGNSGRYDAAYTVTFDAPTAA